MEDKIKKFLSVVNSGTGKIVCGFLIIIAGIWIPASLYGLKSWTAIPSVFTSIFTVVFGFLVAVRGCMVIKWTNDQ